MKKRIFLLSIVALFVSTIITISTPTQTHADAILDIAAFTDLYECYKGGGIQPSITDLKGNSHDISKYVKKGGLFATTRPLPNAYQHTVSNNSLNCYQLVTGFRSGKQSFTGIISNGKYSYSQQEMINFLPKVGYNEPQGSGNNSNNPCASFIYTVKASGYSAENEQSTNQFCVSEVDSSSKITSNSKITINSTRNDAGPKLSKKDRDRAIKVQYGNKIALVNGETFEEYVLKVYNEIRRVRPEYSEGQEVTIEFTLKQYDPSANITGGAQTANGDKVNGEWRINNMETAADIAIKNFSSYSGHNNLKFTSEQKSTLYKHYLKNWYGATVICEGDSGYEDLLATAIKATNVTSKNCFVNATEHKDDKVHGIKSDMTWYQDLSLEQLIAAMSEDDILGANTFSDPEEGEESAEEDRKPDCHTNAGALGWILCPVIAIASDTVEKVYTDLIMPYLSIDAALFDLNEPGGEAVRNVWSLFQGFANLAFVILFLFVIFSQLSGVGIDNYGIKKILPKLIIGAVLINLSYIICQLAVDLSNILGRAIADMFSKFAEGINSTLAAKSINLYPGKASDVPGLFSDIVSNKAAIVVIAGALGLGAFLAAGPAIIIPAVLALISVVIGIFFLFVLLALRQAIAVILVVVSPMAFAMYILPNTKSIFDKWYQTFKGMLLAFPIASALVFGGDFVSKILLAAEGSETITSLGLVLSAAAVAVAPIFFIPDVIRKSMGALSGIANFVQRGQQHTTSRLGKGASDGIRNSGLQRASNQFNERRRAGINRKGEISLRGKVQNKLAFTAGQRAKIAEQRNKALGYVGADKTNRRMLTDAGVAAASAGIAAKARQQEINDEITNMATETGNYNTDVMESMLAGYMARKDLTNAEEMKAKALMTKLSQAGGDGNKRLANIIRGKAKDKDGNSLLMSDAGRKLFADYATNSDVANNISSKDAYAAQYLRDMQAEQAESGSTGITNKTTFDQWAAKSDSAGRNMSNEEFVATKQLDDDEYLMRQSGDSLHQTVGIQGAVTQDRAQRILDNDNINKKESQIKELEKTNAKMRTSSNNGNNNNNNNNGGNKNNGNNNNGNGNNNNGNGNNNNGNNNNNNGSS